MLSRITSLTHVTCLPPVTTKLNSEISEKDTQIDSIQSQHLKRNQFSLQYNNDRSNCLKKLSLDSIALFSEIDIQQHDAILNDQC